MFKPIALFIGLRYTRAQRSNHFISFIALVSMIGLMLGVAVLITVLSVMNGFDRELKNRILGMIPQATVASGEIIPDWQNLVSEVEKHPKVMAAAPFTQIQGMITAQGQVSGVVISGIEPALETKVSIVQNHMSEGTLDALKSGEFGIVLGQSLTDGLGLRIGEKVTLVLPEASPSPAGVIPRFKRFTLVGTFNIGSDVDGMIGYIHLNDASRLLRLPDGAQGVRMKLDDIFAAPQVSRDLAQQLPNVYPSDWTQTHGNLFAAIQMEKMIVSLLLFFIVLVAAFNIVSSLVMVVTDKKSDIAILRTLGASPATITRVFMVQGVIIGAIGTFVGTALGVLFALTISDVFGFVSGMFGLHLMDAYFINYLPSQLRWSDVVYVAGISLTLSFLATIYPAIRAAKVQPAEALRYE
ncbi:MAG: lipoprotein-releasing ABC transporter permease subunit [Pseudomonadota bacterium]|nr:lipoprotein-releasing ABC transporter permease subunit [Pseudomonadota bacterium]